MQLTDVAAAVRRRKGIASGFLGATLLLWGLLTFLPRAESTASNPVFVEPTSKAGAKPLQAVQALAALLPSTISSQRFHADVAQHVLGGSGPPVKLSAQAQPETGQVLVLATSPSPAAAVTWVNVATGLLRQGAAGSSPQSQVVVLGAAHIDPRSAGRLATLLGALAIGTILGCLAAIGVESLRVLTLEQRVRRRLGVAVLAELPKLPDGTDLAPGRLDDAVPDLREFREALQALRVRLWVETRTSSRPTFAVTSSTRGEGRSTVAANLAWMWAATGTPVDLIEVMSVVSTQTDHSPYSSAGSPVSLRLSQLDTSDTIQALRHSERAVVVDAPPAGPNLVPATAIAATACHALVVVDRKRSSLSKLSGVIAELDSQGVSVAGIVLNRVRSHQHRHRPLWADPPPPAANARAVGVAPSQGTAVSGLPRRFGASILGSYGAVAVAGLSALFVTPIVVHHLGRSAFGAFVLISTIGSYLLLANLGFGTALVKLMAEDAGGDERRLVQTFNTGLAALTALGFIALVIGLGFAAVFPRLFGVPAGLHTQATIAFAILAVTVACQVPGASFISVILAFQRYDIGGTIDAVGVAFVGVGTIVAAEAGAGLVGLTLVAAAGTLLLVLLPWLAARRLEPSLRISPGLIDRPRFRSITRLSAWYLLQDLSVVLNQETDLVVVGALLGIRSVAVFAIGSQLSQLALKAVTPFRAVFFPHVSSVSVGIDAGPKLQAVLLDGTRVTLAVAIPSCLVVMMLAGPALRVWVGPGFSAAAPIVVLLAGATIAGALASVASQLLVGLGFARRASVIGLSGAAANLGLSVALAIPLGAPGVAVGSLVAAAVVSLPLTVGAACHVVNTSVTLWGRRCIVPHLIPSAVTLLLLAVVRLVVEPSALPVIGGGACSLLVYVGVYLLTGSTELERADLRRTWRRVATRQ